MKKVVVGFLALVMVFALAGCGGIPSDMSEDVYHNGLNALEVADRYLDGDLDKDDAYRQMSRIKNATPYTTDSENRKDGVVSAKLSLMTALILTDDYAGLRESRDELADDLGK